MTVTVTIEFDCDSREIAVKLLAELKSLNRPEGAFLKHALLDEDWFDWLQSVKEKTDKTGDSKTR